jgi:Rhodopirellula transposase DDE domain
MDNTARLAEKFAAIFPDLNVQQRRVLLAAEARALGRGGVTQVARAAGVSRATVHKALRELVQRPAMPLHGQKDDGDGQHRTPAHDPSRLSALEALITAECTGSFPAPLRWTCQSTQHLAAALRQRGYDVSKRGVRACLHAAGYRLQPSALGRVAGSQATRTAQFHVLATHLFTFCSQALPVVIVTTATTMLYETGAIDAGRLLPVDMPLSVRKSLTRYGEADQEHETVYTFVVYCISYWWQLVRSYYPPMASLLFCVDDGLLHPHRLQAWRQVFSSVAQMSGHRVTVCHVPPGTHKWTATQRPWIYREMQPDTERTRCHIVQLALLGDAPFSPAHPVESAPRSASLGEALDAPHAGVRLVPHAVHGEWNYTLVPIQLAGKV